MIAIVRALWGILGLRQNLDAPLEAENLARRCQLNVMRLPALIRYPAPGQILSFAGLISACG